MNRPPFLAQNTRKRPRRPERNLTNLAPGVSGAVPFPAFSLNQAGSICARRCSAQVFLVKNVRNSLCILDFFKFFTFVRSICLKEKLIEISTSKKRNWISDNPAIELKAPKVTLRPTLPFDNEERRRILLATERYKEEMPSHGVENGRRIRGLVLLLRYSGMRIGDAVNFNTERLQGNRVFLYTQKTGVAVNTVLPEFVVSALEETPRVTNKFFFWSGSGKLESIAAKLADTPA